MVLPAGKDPDDVVRQDPDSWGELSAQAVPAVDFVLTRLGTQFDLATARGKSEAVYDALPVIRDLADPIERSHYERRLAEIVGIDRSDLMRVIAPTVRPRQAAPQSSLPHSGADLEEYLLALSIVSGDFGNIPESLPIRPEVNVLLGMLAERTAAGETVDEVLESLSESEFSTLALVVYREAERLRLREATELIQERKTAILKFELGRLYREVDDVKATLLDVTEDEPEHDEMLWARALDTMTRRIHEIESELSDARKVGTAVWRPRATQEVMGA